MKNCGMQIPQPNLSTLRQGTVQGRTALYTRLYRCDKSASVIQTGADFFDLPKNLRKNAKILFWLFRLSYIFCPFGRRDDFDAILVITNINFPLFLKIFLGLLYMHICSQN